MMPARQFWRKRRVLITGASGFIGSRLALGLLEREAEVVLSAKGKVTNPLFSRQALRRTKAVVRTDIADFLKTKEMFKRYRPDTCFHLAGQSIVGLANDSPFPTFNANIEGAWNILEAARQAGVKRLIIASADKVYGEQKEPPHTEAMPLSAVHPYGASKICAELLGRTYFNSYGLPVAILRASNTYGGGDLNFSRIIPGTIRSVLHNEDPVIRGDGSALRDFVYAEDIVSAYLTLAESLRKDNVEGESFNFGSGRPVSILNIVNKIIEISGRKKLKARVTGLVNPRNEISSQYLSVGKAARVLGWRPRCGLEKGLRLTIRWYEDFFGRQRND